MIAGSINQSEKQSKKWTLISVGLKFKNEYRTNEVAELQPHRRPHLIVC
jgi:hypothetical protein